MKILKNKTEYTIYKGMGDVVIGTIVDYHKFKCSFHPINNMSFGLDSPDLKFIYQEMEKLESKYKKCVKKEVKK